MGLRWAPDGPRWPKTAQDGPKTVPRWSQDGAKTKPRRPQIRLSYVAELHTDADCPKSSKLASRLSEVRFLDELGSTFAVLQRYQKVSPPHPPTLRDRVGTRNSYLKVLPFPLYTHIHLAVSIHECIYTQICVYGCRCMPLSMALHTWPRLALSMATCLAMLGPSASSPMSWFTTMEVVVEVVVMQTND